MPSTLFPYELIDLTHTLHENVPSWDGSCGFQHEIKLDYNQCESPVKFRVQKIKMDAGIGTHIDAPAHCILGGQTIDQLSLENLISPCILIDVSEFSHEHYRVSAEDIINFENQFGEIISGSFVMVRTGWEKYWNNPVKYRNNYNFPSISSEAAEILLKRNIVGLGIDTLSPDRPQDNFRVHELFLGQNKYLIENAASLQKLPSTGSFILALPIKIKGGTEAPIRLVGFLNAG